MYRFDSPNPFEYSRGLKENGSLIERAIDAPDGDFIMNSYGHIRSDFAVLVDTNDSVELSKALMAMQTAYQENSSQFDGMTFEQMVKVIRPRWCQLPGEVDKFEQYLIDEALDFYKTLRKDEESVLNDEGIEVQKPATLAPNGEEASAS